MQQQEMGLAQSFYYKPNTPQHQYILMTYRSGIKPIYQSTYYTSDAGWGCMLRTGQMFIANLLSQKQRQLTKQQIVQMFHDNSETPFGIQEMTKLSKVMFPQMKDFEWYTPCQVGFLVKQLLESYNAQKYEVIICNDGSMFLEDIMKEDQIQDKKDTKQEEIDHKGNEQFHNNQNTKSNKVESIDQSSKSKEKSQEKPQNLSKYIIVLIMARIGLDSPQLPYIRCVSRLMQCKYFLSIMGGTPRHAHLILQHKQNYFGYLDPHTTHSVPAPQKISESLNQYISKLQWIKQHKIDSSMAIGFCFRRQDAKKFWAEIQLVKEQMKQDFFIYVDEKRPVFDEADIIEFGDSDEEKYETQDKQGKQIKQEN